MLFHRLIGNLPTPRLPNALSLALPVVGKTFSPRGQPVETSPFRFDPDREGHIMRAEKPVYRGTEGGVESKRTALGQSLHSEPKSNLYRAERLLIKLMCDAAFRITNARVSRVTGGDARRFLFASSA